MFWKVILTVLILCCNILCIRADTTPSRNSEKIRILIIKNETDLHNLKPNTSYIIDDVIHINADVILPENTTLIFNKNGRLIDNGYLVGNNTKIVSDNANNPIFNEIGTLKGYWNVERIYPRWFGAAEDGIKDDTEALQKAIKTGGTVLLGDAYSISKPMRITKDVVIKGKDSGYTLINYRKPKGDQVFELSEKVDARIEHVETSNGGLLHITSGACNLLLTENRIINNTERRIYGISRGKTTGFFELDYFEISNNSFENITVAYIDRVISSSLIFEDNTATNCIGYILRSIINDQRVQGYISLQRNHITNLRSGNNGAARILQASVETTIDYRDNYIQNIHAEKSGNFVYWKKGNLNFINNTCLNISSSTAGIHDKGVSKKYMINIQGNTFDQSEVSYRLTNKPNPKLGIININAAHNVTIQDNVYSNLKTFALRISRPFSEKTKNGQIAKNIKFSNNKINNVDFKSVILVSQAVENFEISNNCVDGLRNSQTKNNPRFVELLVTKPQGKIMDVFVKENTLHNIADNALLLRTNNNDLACNSITNVSCDSNTQMGGQAFVKILKGGVDRFSVTNNRYSSLKKLMIGVKNCYAVESKSLNSNIQLDISQNNLFESNCM